MIENNTQALQVMQPTAIAHRDAFEPRSIPEAMDLAKMLFAGGLIPKAFSRPEAVLTAIIAGRELGLSAMQSIRGIHIIEGKPTLSADTMAALCKASPTCEYFRMVDSTATSATFETKRRDEPSPTRMTYTKEDAQTAGRWGSGNWGKHPAAMLRARCISGLARAVYQDLLMGIYDPDEVDFAPVRLASLNVIDAEYAGHDTQPGPTQAEREAAAKDYIITAKNEQQLDVRSAQMSAKGICAEFIGYVIAEWWEREAAKAPAAAEPVEDAEFTAVDAAEAAEASQIRSEAIAAAESESEAIEPAADTDPGALPLDGPIGEDFVAKHSGGKGGKR